MEGQTEGIRIQKWLSEMGVGSRREAEGWLKGGRLSVNGRKVVALGTRIVPGDDKVALDGKLIKNARPPREYWMFYKPDGVITTRFDPENRPTIYDVKALSRHRNRLSPVGRLDLKTEGLLLLSNDGEWVNRMMHPSSKIVRHYEVLLARPLSSRQEETIRKGIYLEDGPVKNIRLERKKAKRLGKSKGMWYRISLKDGRNRVVRRVLETQGARIVMLRRVGFGSIRLPEDLAPGQMRKISAQRLRTMGLGPST